MRRFGWFTLVTLLAMSMPSPALAHFGMLIPSDSMVMPQDNRTLELTLSFSHPFERLGMVLEKPHTFGVMARGERLDLLETLAPTEVMGSKGWRSGFSIKRPGVFIFYMQPGPYWEPMEDLFIVHYTKTVVAAFGYDEGWDEPVGLKTEIIPLSRPYGLYAGNVFQGMVLVEGKPAAGAEVEVEYYDSKGRVRAPTPYMVTQTLKADENGVFTYAAPAPGWWGFAALTKDDRTIPYQGAEKDVEIGAVLWVKFEAWQEK